MVKHLMRRIRLALKQPGLTKVKLASDAGIHRNTLLHCERDDWNPTANTLIALEPFIPLAAHEQAPAASNSGDAVEAASPLYSERLIDG